MPQYPVHEVQGLLFSGYRAQRNASYLMLRVESREAARAWVRGLVPRVCWGGEKRESERLNVGFTDKGLDALGVSGEALASFSPAFHQGMDAERRSRILGDVGSSAPGGWRWGGPQTSVHAVLLLFAGDAAAHAAQLEREKRSAREGGLAVAAEIALAPLPGRKEEMREPFGFADGLSQPYFDGAPGADALSEEAHLLHFVEVGEFLLGYKNVYGEITSVPWLSDPDEEPRFGRNGSYLVLRQLSQDIAGFWRHFRAQAGAEGAQGAQHLAAKAVGRWRNGSPLATNPDRPGPRPAGDANDFSYSARDPFGDGCPLGAHVRRANPRDGFEGTRNVILKQVNGHRLLRRGRPYGPPLAEPERFEGDGAERGLLFACLNANIERQFEFVQHSWIDNPNFHGLYGEQDPLVGSHGRGGGRFSIQGAPVRRRLSGIPRFVETRGGAYFFLPGRSGLAALGA